MFQIKVRHILCAVVALFMYFYLSNVFSRPTFQQKFKDFLGEQNTNHTIFQWMESGGKGLAGLISVSSGFILNSVPVS